MTKEEFKNWSNNLFKEFIDSSECDFTQVNNGNVIIVFNTNTGDVGISNSKTDCIPDFESGLAIAYARLKGIEIPEIEEVPTAWRAEIEERYYYIYSTGSIQSVIETGNQYFDTKNYNIGNYFKTKEQAESACKKINHLLRLQRLHDMLCPDYEPDWSSDVLKYSIAYDEGCHVYTTSSRHLCNSRSDVYFTKEAAEKACEILNEEGNINE